jgi:molybdopterin molybdotransferase
MADLDTSNRPITVAQALTVVAGSYSPVTAIETVPLAAACDRVLAAAVVAPIAVPASDNSAVDGYAFRHTDLGRAPLKIAGTAAAGHPYLYEIAVGEAVRIFTGGIMPLGADTVVPQENVSVTGRSAVIPPDIRIGENRRRAGEDIEQGATILSAGTRLGPAAVGLLASVGIAEVAVRARLRVAVFSTGDELRGDAGALEHGQIHDSNRPVLLALLGRIGIAATDLGILPDREDIIRTRLADAARTHDAVICSAGMSVGDEDHVKSAVRSLGALDFWSVAIKPGRPIAVGQISPTGPASATATPFFGLPGNPVAMIVTFLVIVRPALLRLSGADASAPRRFPVTADFHLPRTAGKREFLRCTLHDMDGSGPRARRFERGGAGVLSSVADSEGLLEIGEDVAGIEPGQSLPFIPFSSLGL